ncbi:hypothetical protein [Methanovulcanius yangii]|uniref:hypothetical protein n=1 Tax=Methanovulcanius yangii TaxID=1789227 RepID=UPI0029CAA484|nr:hypothetical protein [Methanovulcanius yangii]
MSGLALGAEVNDNCGACNVEYGWLINRPSTFVWADKIIVTPKVYEQFKEGTISTEGKFGPVFNKIFEIAEDFNVIDIKSPNQVINNNISNNICDEIKFDVELLMKLFPDSIKPIKDSDAGDDSGIHFISIEGEEYCFPMLFSMYTSLRLAKEWNAEPLISDHFYTYCKYKFGLSLIHDRKSRISAFDSIFSFILPEKSLIPYYALPEGDSHKCNVCKHYEKCGNTYLEMVETNVHEYLELREHDEIEQMKNCVGEIIRELRDLDSDYSNEELIKKFQSEKVKINRDLKKTFPKMKRWANVVLVASTPAALIGTMTGLPAVSVPAASMAGLSVMVKEAIQYQESKYKWIGFMDKIRKDKIKPEIK